MCRVRSKETECKCIQETSSCLLVHYLRYRTVDDVQKVDVFSWIPTDQNRANVCQYRFINICLYFVCVWYEYRIKAYRLRRWKSSIPTYLYNIFFINQPPSHWPYKNLKFKIVKFIIAQITNYRYRIRLDTL